MDRRIEEGFGHAQVAGEEAGKVEGAKFRITHGQGSERRVPCGCDMCSRPATAEIITRSGVMLACPECARIEWGNIHIQLFVIGERHARQYA